MKFGHWGAGVSAGLLIGLFLGWGQQYFLSSQHYFATAVLKERIVFNEYWTAAPDALVKAELLRSFYSKCDQHKTSVLPSIQLDMLNAWFRFLDNYLFDFSVDEALKSTFIGSSFQRYASLHPGVNEGLGQRVISFRVVAEDADTARTELLKWIDSVEEKSKVTSSRALQSWVIRKADSLGRLAEQGGMEVSKQSRAILKEMAYDFTQTAEHMPVMAPYVDEPLSVKVEPVPRSVFSWMFAWGGMGGGIALLVMLVWRTSKTR